MIPCEATIERFIRSRQNFFLYGPRASGKTTLLKKVFEKTEADYIYINCTMGDKKVNFFRYLSHQTASFIKRKYKKHYPNFDQYNSAKRQNPPTTIHAWLQQMKSTPPTELAFLKNMYLLIDNIEEIHVSTNFMTTFFIVCQEELPGFKIPFVFCGVNLPRKIYAIDKPFRNITSFCMPKPLDAMKTIIYGEVSEVLRRNFQTENWKTTDSDIERATISFTTQIFHAFESIETDLNKISKIARSISEVVTQIIKNEELQRIKMNKQMSKEKGKADKPSVYKLVTSMINKGELKKYFAKSLEEGPINDYLLRRNEKEQQIADLQYEYYSNLLMTACHMADICTEKYDRYRFKDYKKSKLMRKEIPTLDNRIAKHNLQRVIAISEVLDNVSKNKEKEEALQHHTLDFYGCIEFLNDEEKFFMGSKNMSFSSSKVHGMLNEEEIKAFCKKYDIKYAELALTSANN